MNKQVVNQTISTLSDGTPICSFLTPSRFKVSIREQNGEDDDVLTLMRDNKNGSAFFNFVHRIITECEGYDQKNILTPDAIRSWKVRDRNYVVFKSRQFSLGSEVTFDYLFTGESKPQNFTEFLTNYDWDFSKSDNPAKKGEPGYDPRIFQPYPNAKASYVPELTLKSNPRHEGWKVRFKYLTGEGEVMALGMNQEDMAINDKLRLRGFEVSKTPGAWQFIERFDMFSSLEMKEIRAHLELNDPDFLMTSEVRNVNNGLKEYPGLMQVDGFFFPAG